MENQLLKQNSFDFQLEFGILSWLSTSINAKKLKLIFSSILWSLTLGVKRSKETPWNNVEKSKIELNWRFIQTWQLSLSISPRRYGVSEHSLAVSKSHGLPLRLPPLPRYSNGIQILKRFHSECLKNQCLNFRHVDND